MEYKVSCKVEGQFGKTSAVVKAGRQPIGTEKIKSTEPYFLVEGTHDDDILKVLLRNVAATFCHQKHVTAQEFATAYQNAVSKFNLN